MNNDNLKKIFEMSTEHRKKHECGGYPYEHADVLAVLLKVMSAKKILELGTGLGYTAAIMAGSSEDIHIETIDRDREHLRVANENWQDMGVSDKITGYLEKAEVILPTLSGPYDLIFFDGHVPSLKFLLQFERLLRKGGLLVTANMFLRDVTGGKYMRALQNAKKWQVGIFADTTVALKLVD